eukprot:CAMPEP_0201901792 /NCGR_PEP_ID=MMETSP0902-20130614/54618_1 /ASSEMBLY_ACC=CAM_ASM_000551 /TAXON_ID=420261 /ORGANISM="Thalassiosira antarctica, Strain CCMP982" /LENGTH=60 /DNA_ID=CAMNT_0048435767 /DNA_START=330 /DNA_END=512 /DNA_ORIENTATION=+
MDKSEMAVFAALGVSVTIGLMQMGSNVWQVYGGGSTKSDDMSQSAASPTNWSKTESDATR